MINVEVESTPGTLTKLMVNEVSDTQINYYFCNDNLTRCVLASNSGIGLTGVFYKYNSSTHAMTQSSLNIYLSSSTPSDYYDSVKSGNFEIEVVP